MQVCEAAGIRREDLAYIEAHGTGTVAGDAQELAAIDRVYGKGAGRVADAPLLLGSVKSNMGHCEGCSGLAGGRAQLEVLPSASTPLLPQFRKGRMQRSPCVLLLAIAHFTCKGLQYRKPQVWQKPQD